MKRRIWPSFLAASILSRAAKIASSVGLVGSLPMPSITSPSESRISVKNPIRPENSGSNSSLMLFSSRPVSAML